MASPTVYLPYTTLQPSFPTVVQEIKEGLHAAEDVWCSCYSQGQPSVHGRVRMTEAEGGGAVELAARGGVECELVSNTTLRISCRSLSIPPTPLHFPSSTPCTLKGGIDCFALSPDGSRVVVGGKDGAVRVGELGGSGKQVQLRGHVGDVTDLRFFPSSEVVLSASIDMSIRVFSALDGSNPRTLTGHTKSVTSLHILGRGRQVLSSSLDGTVRLWNVAQAETVRTWRFDQPVTAICVAPSPSPSSTTLDDSNPDLNDLILFATHTNGTATIISLASSSSASSAASPLVTLKAGTSPLDAIAYDASHKLVALGSRNGVVSLFQLVSPLASSPASSPNEPLLALLSFSRSSATIHSLAFSTKNDQTSLLVASADGLPFRAGWELADDGESHRVWVKEEFAGLDCEAAREVSERDGVVWIAGADGSLRRYLVG